MAENIPRSTLALVERPDSFMLQQRPNLPGRLAYAGKIHFFGRGVEAGEHPYAALRRELLAEELSAPGWDLSDDVPEPLWEGKFSGENKRGEPVLRHITLYGLEMPGYIQAVPSEAEGGDIVYIPKNAGAIEVYREEMAPFAFEALTSYVRTGHVLIS